MNPPVFATTHLSPDTAGYALPDRALSDGALSDGTLPEKTAKRPSRDADTPISRASGPQRAPGVDPQQSPARALQQTLLQHLQSEFETQAFEDKWPIHRTWGFIIGVSGLFWTIIGLSVYAFIA